MRSVLRYVLYPASAFCFLAAFAPLLLGTFLAIAVSANEYHGIENNDRPKSYASLKFGPWQTGHGQLQQSHIVNLPPGCLIMRYRIGSDTNLLCVFTYYEAEYRLPDGSTRITRKWAHEHVYCTQANRGRRVHSISDTWHSPVGRGR